MTKNVRKPYFTSCPTYYFSFEKFVIGMYTRMGDVVHQDKAINNRQIISSLNKIGRGLREWK